MSPLRKKFEAEAKEYFAKYGYKRKRTSYDVTPKSWTV